MNEIATRTLPALGGMEMHSLLSKLDEYIENILRILAGNTRFVAAYMTAFAADLLTVQRNSRLFRAAVDKWRTRAHNGTWDDKRWPKPYRTCVELIPAIVALNGDQTRDPVETADDVVTLIARAGLTRTELRKLITKFKDLADEYTPLEWRVAEGTATSAERERRQALLDILGDTGRTLGAARQVTPWMDRYVAIETLVTRCYEKKVISHARKYDGSREDIMQEGRDGVLRAIGDHDYRQHTAFAKTADGWVTQRVIDFIKRLGNTISVPATTWADGKKIDRAVRALKRDGLEETVEAIVERTGLDADRVVEVERLRSLARVGSLDQPTTTQEGAGQSRVETVRADSDTTISAVYRYYMDTVLDYVETLDNTDRRLLSAATGLDLDSV